MKIIKTGDFIKAFQKLPSEIQRLSPIQENRFRNNWHDPRLHIKKIQSLPFAFSFRITRRYRVFFYLQNRETAVFFDVDHRKDVYR
ncbi:MAG: hypothetical protein Q8R36_02800 [bacterium]|nr:hypothetical protein [bacterium]